MTRVWVAMSGGVDSSVAAALMVQQGHDVTGVTMQLWPSDDTENGCCNVSAVADARRVCDVLGIPHYALNYRETFRQEVVEPFARAYASGLTPNPCIACNERVKFSSLLAKVSLQGADLLVTGHYARRVDLQGIRRLARGVDEEKDQSYFLYMLTPTQLEHVAFPLGEMTKPEVREAARELGLPTATRRESQDICFVTAEGRAELVGSYCPESLVAGSIVDSRGEVLGRHAGVAHYTVGQRKGLGVGGLSEPLYVTGIDAARNTVVAGPRSDLAATRVECDSFTWGSEESQRCAAMVRYRMKPADCIARVIRTREGSSWLVVEFSEPVYGIAPGQSVVCYGGDVVLGGGVITCVS